MNGMKKIKVIFIEVKVLKEKREEWLVVCDVSGIIIWVFLLKWFVFVILKEMVKKDKYMIIYYKSKEFFGRIMKWWIKILKKY